MDYGPFAEDVQAVIDFAQVYEDVFAAYQYGAWPCGWEGDYRKGRMAIFVKKEE